MYQYLDRHSADSIQSEDTVYSADSIEFSPVQHDIFVCGTYQIEKMEEMKDKVENEVSQKSDNDDDDEEEEAASAPKTRRLGRALVYQVAGDGQSLYVLRHLSDIHGNLATDSFAYLLSKEIQRFDGPAILDMKW
jgi:diphthamide biosynthesis protein 7